MTEHKYTDEEVIKAMEHCVHAERGGYKCRECVNVTGCKPWLLREALDLINRQKAEVAFWMDAAANAKKEAVKEFAERLKTEEWYFGRQAAVSTIDRPEKYCEEYWKDVAKRFSESFNRAKTSMAALTKALKEYNDKTNGDANG